MELSEFQRRFRGASRVFGNLENSKGVFGVLGEDANYKANQQAPLLWGRCGGRGEESEGKPKKPPRQTYGNLPKPKGNLGNLMEDIGIPEENLRKPMANLRVCKQFEGSIRGALGVSQ